MEISVRNKTYSLICKNPIKIIKKREFSQSCCVGKSKVSVVNPVHHKIRFKNWEIADRSRIFRVKASDIHSNKFKPYEIKPDRFLEYYNTTIKPDLLLMNYRHNEKNVQGKGAREWSGVSPYHINRPVRRPWGGNTFLPSIKVRNWKNIPKLKSITLHSTTSRVVLNRELIIPLLLQFQQITGKRACTVRSKSNIMAWKIRPHAVIGAKVVLKGPEMHQFLATLVDVVLPRLDEWNGISNRSGSKFGSISFGLKPKQALYFPEIEANSETFGTPFGFDIFFSTTAQTDSEARTLLSAYGLPFYGKERVKQPYY